MAGLNGAWQSGGRAGRRRRATQLKAENEKPGEEQIAQERVAEKHPGRRGAISRHTDRQRLEQSTEVLHVPGIEGPGDDVRDDVKDKGGGE